MPNLMQTIASAFEAEPKTSTIADVGLVANRLTAPLMGNLGFGGQQRSQQNSSQSHSAHFLTADALGLPKREVYQRALQIKADG